MSTKNEKLLASLGLNAAETTDLTKPVVSEAFVAAEGATRLRLVGYVELGTHESEWKGVKKLKPKVEITFELSGRNHEPRVLDSGEKMAHRVVIRENVGFTNKNGYMKLFSVLNYSGTHQNYLSMLATESWRGTVSHRQYEVGGNKRVAAELKKDGVFQIYAPEFEDPETGELRKIVAGDVVSKMRVFVWNRPSLEQWDSLFIDGEFDNGDTKNVLQEKIKRATNFVGSPIYELLKEAGRADELIPAQRAATAEDGEDDEDEDAAPAVKAGKSPAKAVREEKAATKAVVVSATAAKTKAKDKGKPAVETDEDPLAGM